MKLRPVAGTPAAPAVRMPVLWGLAWLAFQQGDDACMTDCARALGELADRDAEPIDRRNAATLRGLVALARQEIDDAVRSFGAAVELARGADDPWLSASSLLNFAMAETAAGRTSEAQALLATALRAYEELGEQKGIAEALTGLATAAALRGAPIRAARLGGAAERIRESFAGRALPVERRLAEAEFARARDAAAQRWDDEWIRGRALRADEAVEAALELTR